jgi:acyl transferase domain-containing protein
VENNLQSVRPSDIAIVSMDGRFPGAKTVEKLWENICAGQAGLKDFGHEFLANSARARIVQRFGVLAEPEWFDPAFFALTARDGLVLNPQFRLFLECCHHALDEAGCLIEGYQGRAGIVAAASHNDYGDRLRKHLGNIDSRPYNQPDFLATYAAYICDLKGIALTVQSGCSSSLVAVHIACQSLLNFETDFMLAGGTCVVNLDREGYLYEPGGILSADGHCRPFDAQATGTVPGDAVVVIGLKRHQDALEENNIIHAIIRGTAVNNDGRVKASFFAPSARGQAAALQDALSFAGLEPSAVGYIESHGTGTTLGDPIEFAALREVFDDDTRTERCRLGSVKSAIGHSDVSAGLCGLIKAALIVREGIIPIQVDYSEPNPEIDIAASSFDIPTSSCSWPSSLHPRIAGVTALGIGGTNAHVILEQPPVKARAASTRIATALPVSAHNNVALRMRAKQIGEVCCASPGLSEDVSFTLGTARKIHSDRVAVIFCRSTKRVIEISPPELGPQPSDSTKRRRDIVFAFPGQGNEYRGIAREWYKNEPLFRKQFDECRRLLLEVSGVDVLHVLVDIDLSPIEFGASGSIVAQAALFVFEYCAACTLIEWGIRPDLMIGHSLGEIVCACVASSISLKDALRLVVERGQRMADVSGAMAAVAVTEAEARILSERYQVDVAAVNGPRSCVLSGTVVAIEELESALRLTQTKTQRLETSGAFHSHLTEAVCGPFEAAILDIAFAPPRVPYVSTVTGTLVSQEMSLGSEFWARHIRLPVLFSQGMTCVLSHSYKPIIVEVGPGETLTKFTMALRGSLPAIDLIPIMPRPDEDESRIAFDRATAIGKLWVCGAPFDWRSYHSQEARRQVQLPNYPFQRIRLWPGDVVPDSSIREPATISSQIAAAGHRQATTIVLEVAASLLGVKPRLEDNFFSLGGNSLLAVRFASELSRRLGAEVVPRDVMAADTLQCLVIAHNDLRQSVERSTAPVVPLSPAQRWMWLWHARASATSIFNVPYGLAFRHHLTPKAVAKQISRTLGSFDALRLRFRLTADEVVQYCTDDPPAVDLVELRGIPRDEIEFASRSQMMRGMARPFDLLSEAPIRVTLFNCKSDFLLSVVIHHIAIDGWSLAKVANALVHVLKTGEMSEVQPSYLSFASSQQLHLNSEHVRFWKKYLKDLPPNIEHPGDLKRPSKFSFAAGEVRLRIDKESTQTLKAYASKERLTPYHILLSAFAIELSRSCSQSSEVWVRSPTANRESNSMEVVGFCLGTIVLRFRDPAERDFLQVVRQTATETIDALGHSNVPPLGIVDAAGPVSAGHFSRFPFEFNYLEFSATVESPGKIDFREISVPPSIQIKADLSLTCFSIGDMFELSLSYYSEAFSHSFAEQFLNNCVLCLTKNLWHPSGLANS